MFYSFIYLFEISFVALDGLIEMAQDLLRKGSQARDVLTVNSLVDDVS